ncbi:MAG: PAS domain-containing sensor histidine kinase [Campylobacterales bacterium]|nr:PAS domain-containing sensor histidine kinase [Campylobacterales bacterium]
MDPSNSCKNKIVSHISLQKNAKIVAKRRATSSLELLQQMSLEDIAEIFHNLEVHQIELEMQNNELMEIQEQLNQSKDHYCKLYNRSPVGYITLNPQNIILHANLTAHTLLENPKYTLSGQPFTRFIDGEDQDKYYLLHQKLLESNEPYFCELRMLTREGTIFWVCMSCHIDTKNDSIPRINVVINDITKRKEIETKLKSNEEILLIQSRQAAMGEMISMIAHQWRQPLNIMGLAISNIEMKRALNTLSDTEFEKKIEVITNNITFMSETIDDFRHFFQPNQPKEELKVASVLKSTLDIIGKSLEHHSITVSLEENTQRLLPLFKSQLIQVLLNLINNAKEALLINQIPSPSITLAVNESEENIIISVCDNAGGIPQKVMERISEPYFTTKGLNGTGLGLYIAKTIIERNFNGTLTWHNKKEGACFVLTLS